MKQFEKVTKTYETEDISKVNCDRCGREIDLNIKKEKYVGLSFSLRNTFDRENSSQVSAANMANGS
jgi:hypothetical protein